MKSEIYDVVVIGGGPAGSSAALHLAKHGCSVLVLEKSIFPRDKVCGEFISPRSWEFLDLMGLRNSIESSGYHPVKQALLYAPSGRFLRIVFRSQHAIGLSRMSFDSLLLKNAQRAGVEIREGILVTDFNRDEHHSWTVKGVTKQVKEPELFQAHRLIVASGKNLQSSHKTRTGMYGFKTYYKGVRGLNDSLELFFMDVGYGGVLEVEQEKVNVCFLLDIEKAPKEWVSQRPDEFMNWIFKRHPVLNERMRGAQRLTSIISTGPLPLTMKNYSLSKGDFCAGDALRMMDPFFGEGMTLALEAGLLLSQSGSQEKYLELIHRSFKKRYLLSRWMRYFSNHPMLMNKLIWTLSHHEKTAHYLYRLAHGINA